MPIIDLHTGSFMIRKAPIFLLFAVVAFALIGCGDRKADHPEPPYDPQNPALARVGETIIDLTYFNEAMELLPDVVIEHVQSYEEKRDFLDELILNLIYYQEGVRRDLLEKSQTSSMLHTAREKALVRFAKNKLIPKDLTVSDAAVEAEYNAHKSEYIDDFDRPLSKEKALDQARQKLLNAKKQEVVDQEAEKLETKYGVHYNFELLQPGNETSNKLLIRSGVESLNLTYRDFVKVATELGLGNRLDTYEDRKGTLLYLVRDRLFLDNALAEQMSADPVYQRQLDMVQRFALARFTRQMIIGTDIKADSVETERYYLKHREDFAGLDGTIPEFEDISQKVNELATDAKRKRVAQELADALARGRFSVEVYHDHLEKLWGKP